MSRTGVLALPAAGMLLLGLTACGGAAQPAALSSAPASPVPSSAQVTSVASSSPVGSTAASIPSTPATSAASTTTTAPPASSTAAIPPAGSRTLILLDPGHNGGNATHVHEITKRVPAGRGRTKSCNTTGTESNGGYAEHAFNWDVAKRVKTVLTARGYHVLLTRHSDSGVGPCINERAAIGNRAHAAAVVSIHADGNTGSGNRGFHVEYSSPPLNSAQGRPSIALATDLRDAIASTGAVPISNYTGSHGLFGRDDLGGLNLSDRPTTLIECGNMRNARDEAVLGNAAGRQRFAAGIAAGIAEFTH